MRIAIIGAGPAGLTAGHTLGKLGYKQVTNYEKEGMPGGKVLTDRSLGVPIELGALFATERYRVVLELVNKFGVQLRPSASNTTILDDWCAPRADEVDRVPNSPGSPRRRSLFRRQGTR